MTRNSEQALARVSLRAGGSQAAGLPCHTVDEVTTCFKVKEVLGITLARLCDMDPSKRREAAALAVSKVTTTSTELCVAALPWTVMISSRTTSRIRVRYRCQTWCIT